MESCPKPEQEPREDVTRVLAKRIMEKQMSESQTLTLARKWFWDNPKELYHLEF